MVFRKWILCDAFNVCHQCCFVRKKKKNVLDKKREQGRFLMLLFCRRPTCLLALSFIFVGGGLS